MRMLQFVWSDGVGPFGDGKLGLFEQNLLTLCHDEFHLRYHRAVMLNCAYIDV